jgi:hypothetical protein
LWAALVTAPPKKEKQRAVAPTISRPQRLKSPVNLAPIGQVRVMKLQHNPEFAPHEAFRAGLFGRNGNN